MELEALTADEQVAYVVLTKQLNDFGKGSVATNAKNALLKTLLYDPEVSFSYKTYVSHRQFRIRVVAQWAYRNISGNPLQLLSRVQPLKASTLPYAVKNTNFTPEIVSIILTASFGAEQEFRARFIKELNDEIVTEKFMMEVLERVKKSTRNLDGFYERARIVFGLGEDVPVDWVKRSLGVTP